MLTDIIKRKFQTPERNDWGTVIGYHQLNKVAGMKK